MCYFLNFLAVFDLLDEGLRRLKARDKMLVDDDRCVFRNVTSYFFRTLLIHKATKTPHVDVIAVSH